MKKFFNNALLIGFIVAFVVLMLYLGVSETFDFFQRAWRNSSGIWDFVLYLIKIPFAIFGAIQVLRGYVYVIIERDGEHFKKFWKLQIYNALTLIGIVILFIGF